MRTAARLGFGSLPLEDSSRAAKPVAIADAKKYLTSVRAGARALRKLQAVEVHGHRPVGARVYETDAVQLERLADILANGGRL